jgi:hypothetical protein
MFYDIEAEWTQQSTGYDLKIRADVLRMLTLLIRHYARSESDLSAARQNALFAASARL